MAKTTASERRSKVAEECIDFGMQLLKVRTSSVTANDAQGAVIELYEWFEGHQGFSEDNYGIAIQSMRFGQRLLENRRTTSVADALQSIRDLYQSLSQ